MLLLPPQPSPFVEMPWVQLGDQREKGSLAIVWQTPDAGPDLTFEYVSGGKTRRAATTFRRVNVEGMPLHRVVTAQLSGLRAGAPVRYRLTRSGIEVFSATTVAPKSDRQPYSFAVFGDCGNGSPAQARIAARTVELKPDFLMITGDIVYDGGGATEYRKNFFPAFNNATIDPAIGAPLLRSTLVVGVPGNHDVARANLDRYADGLAYFSYWNQPLNGPISDPSHKSATPAIGSPERMTAFRAAAGPNFPRMANFSFDYGNSHWTCLDANTYVDWTDAALRKWVADDLKRAKGKTWRFVSFHHPGFHSSKAHQAAKQMRKLAQIFHDGGVDVVFSGHVHNYQRSFPIQLGPKRDASVENLEKDDWPVDRTFDGRNVKRAKGVIYIVTGAGGAGLYDPQLADESGLWKPFQAQYIADFSLSHVAIEGNRFTLRQIDQAGKERDRFTIEK